MFGVLNLCKPSGPTSRDCVDLIEKYAQHYRVGHAGTLDPMATGVLVMLVGQAARLVDEIHELPKEYVGEFQLGLTSDTLDIQGNCVSVPATTEISRIDIEVALGRFVGTIQQQPPAYSAIRVDGKRAYSIARSGGRVEMPIRTVQIHSAELLSFEYPRFEIKVSCGTGTYLRTLGDDIAKMIGTRAVMTRLTRTCVGPFLLQDALQCQQVTSTRALRKFLLPPSSAMTHMAHIVFDSLLLDRILCGQKIDKNQFAMTTEMATSGRLAVLDEQGRLRALMRRDQEGKWHCKKGFIDIE